MAIVVTALISIPLAKKCDRKTLLGISALGVSACLFTLGTFYYLKSIDGVEGFGWLPLVDFMVYIGFFMVSICIMYVYSNGWGNRNSGFLRSKE